MTAAFRLVAGTFAAPRVAIALLLFAGTSEAQPAITGASGTWSHKGAVTISGASFGTKTAAAPTVWDDASGLNILDKWSGAWPNCAGNSAYNLGYRTPAQVGRNIALPHDRITKYISGAHNPGAGADCGYNVIFFKTRTLSFPAYTYAAWYERVDDNWTFGGDDNFKTFAYSLGSGPYSMPNNWYIEYNARPVSRTSTPQWHINDDGTSLVDPDQNGHNWWWLTAINPMSGVWKKIEIEARYTNQSDGYIRQWENGVLKINYAGRTDAMAGTQRTEGIGGYARNYGQPGNWRYFADVYLDYSRARVILGNASTLSASTLREVQVPTSWSSSSIAVNANLGRFTDGQTAYLYVVDPNGTVNAAGFPIVIGGVVTPDTTAPTVSGAAPASGGTSVSPGVNPSVTFNEAMNAATITTATFELRDSANTLVLATVTYDSNNRTATLDPAATLATSQTYTATVRAGTTGVKDVAGNALATAYSWSFTTSSQVQPAGLVVALGFDEGSGTAAADASGNANHGTLQGATWNASGKFGAAASFDGINDWVTVADASSLDLTTGMTLEAWVYPTALSGWRTVILKEIAGGLAYSLYAHDNAPKPAAYAHITGRSVADGAGGTSQLPLNTWTHLAATYDGAMLRLFVNGVETGNLTLPGVLVTGIDPVRIGGNAVWGEYFSGSIDEVRIYNRALTQAEIQADMGAAVGGGGVPAGDTTPPAVSVTAPAAGVTVSGSIALSATASDNVGVAGVQFLVDGVATGSEDTSAPYSVSWNTGAVSNGSHTVAARARDAAGNTTTSAAITVSVQNTIDTTPPTVTSVTPAAGATRVSQTTTISGVFSEEMLASSIGPATIELRNPANALVTASVTYTSATRTFTLTPATTLGLGNFQVTIKAGASGVKDAAGNALAATYNWTFSTANPPAPPQNVRIIR